MNTNGYRMSWAPAPASVRPAPLAPSFLSAALGQEAVPWTLTKTPAIITDIIVTATAFFYAQGLRSIGNPVSTLWYVVSGAAAIKALHDFARES